MKPTRLATIHAMARTRPRGKSVVAPVDRTPKERLITVWNVSSVNGFQIISPVVRQAPVYECEKCGDEVSGYLQSYFCRRLDYYDDSCGGDMVRIGSEED